MAYNRNNYIRIKKEFEYKYIKVNNDAIGRRDELHEKYPDLKQIDDALAETGMRVFAESLRGKQGLEERIAAIKNENLELQAIRREWLVYHGYPENYTDPQYECELCNDTGSIGTVMCECMKRALTLAGYESSGIGNLMKTQSFETFDLSYYLDNPEQYEYMSRVIDYCKRYAGDFTEENRQNLLFLGSTGRGKTHISTSIAKIVIERGFDVVYDTAQNIFADFENERFHRSDNIDRPTSRYFDCDLLIIDDLGTELTNQFTVTSLYNIMNTRINYDRSIIINTNLPISELRKRYSDRIISRLFGEFKPFEFNGADIRQLRLLK